MIRHDLIGEERVHYSEPEKGLSIGEIAAFLLFIFICIGSCISFM